jgi:hypothetical protein
VTVTGLPPASVFQGDSYSWQTVVSDFPSTAGWELRTTIRAETGPALVLVGTGQPDGSFVTVLTAVQTAALVLGVNAWSFRVKDAALVSHTLCNGRTIVLASLETTAPGSVLTPAEKTLAALEAIGPEVMANGYAEMEVDGGKAVFRSLDEYFRALGAAREAVKMERDAAIAGACGTAPKGNRRKILSVFVKPRI